MRSLYLPSRIRQLWSLCLPLAAFLWGLLAFPLWAASAERMDLSLDLQFKLLIQAATYNRTIDEQANMTVNLGIVYTNQSESKEIAQQIFEMFGDHPLTVRKHTFKIVPLLYQSAVQFQKETQSQQIHLYYVAPGNAESLPSILQVSRELKILTLTGVPDYVYEGVTLGVAHQGAKPEFLFNRLTAQNDGTDFHSNFLRMVKIVSR